MTAKTVRTIQGDTFDTISYRQYGTEHHAREIIALNPDYADYVIFPAGIVLTLPETVTERVAYTAAPWYAR